MANIKDLPMTEPKSQGAMLIWLEYRDAPATAGSDVKSMWAPTIPRLYVLKDGAAKQENFEKLKRFIEETKGQVIYKSTDVEGKNALYKTSVENKADRSIDDEFQRSIVDSLIYEGTDGKKGKRLMPLERLDQLDIARVTSGSTAYFVTFRVIDPVADRAGASGAVGPLRADGYPEDKYERCIQKVKEKQSQGCADQGYKAYSTDPETGKSCYNPWAICSRVKGH